MLEDTNRVKYQHVLIREKKKFKNELNTKSQDFVMSTESATGII